MPMAARRHFLDEADALADRVAILREGRLAAAGPALALKARYCNGCGPQQGTAAAKLVGKQVDRETADLFLSAWEVHWEILTVCMPRL